MNDEFEIRGPSLWPDGDFDFRMVGDGLSFRGYAAVFNTPSVSIPGGPRGAFTESIRQGAFNDTLNKNPDITLRTQHNMMMLPLARTKSGTMRLATDDHGLLAVGSLPDNEAGHVARDAIKRGDVDGMSMTFRVVGQPNQHGSRSGEKWSDDYQQRELLSVQLGPELSIVDFPAYPTTSIAVRRLAEIANVEPDELMDAFNVLREQDTKLSPEQHRVIQAAINAKAEAPFIPPQLAKARERLAALGSKQ